MRVTQWTDRVIDGVAQWTDGVTDCVTVGRRCDRLSDSGQTVWRCLDRLAARLIAATRSLGCLGLDYGVCV